MQVRRGSSGSSPTRKPSSARMAMFLVFSHSSWPRTNSCVVQVVFASKQGDQFVLRNTPSIIPAGVGRTRREIGPALKVPLMPKVCANRVAMCAIGASNGSDRVVSSSNPRRTIIRSSVFGEKYQRCSSSSIFHRLPIALATKLSMFGTLAKNSPRDFSTVRISATSSSILWQMLEHVEGNHEVKRAAGRWVNLQFSPNLR